jgi:hypothetical protein
VSPIELLQALLACTPPPPDADPSELIERAQKIAEAREQLVGELKRVLAAGANLDGCAPLAATLDERDRRWVAALERARTLLPPRLLTHHPRSLPGRPRRQQPIATLIATTPGAAAQNAENGGGGEVTPTARRKSRGRSARGGGAIDAAALTRARGRRVDEWWNEALRW